MNLPALHFQSLLDAQRIENELFERFRNEPMRLNNDHLKRQRKVVDQIAKYAGVSAKTVNSWRRRKVTFENVVRMLRKNGQITLIDEGGER